MSARYWWKITRDYIADPDAPEGTNDNAKGIIGPADADETITDNMGRFTMYGDDGEGDALYSGMIYGDYDGFEPLDDFGTWNAGATLIKIDGEWL